MMQIPADAPTTLPALQWVIIGVLATVIIYLYKSKETERKSCQEARDELLSKTLAGLSDVNESLQGVATLIESWQGQFETLQAIQELARRLNHYDKKGG